MKPAILAAAAAFLPLLAWTAKAPARGVDRDKSPDIIISSELEDSSKVLILKDPKVADSLLRLATPPLRGAFDQLLSDSAMVVEIRSREEFRRRWRDLESREGFRDLRAQYAAHDVDKTRIPKLYLFDSSVVIYPGWIILRRK